MHLGEELFQRLPLDAQCLPSKKEGDLGLGILGGHATLMEHNVDLVLRAVGVGVDDVAGPLLGRVARGRGARLLPWGGGVSRLMVSPVVFLLPDCLEPTFRPPAAVPFFFGTILGGMENGSLLVSVSSLLASALLSLLAAVDVASSSSSLVSSLLELSSLESSSFSVIKRWREEGGVRCNVKKQ
jgi:hypothetical protein